MLTSLFIENNEKHKFHFQHKMKPPWCTNGDLKSCQLLCEFIPHFDQEIKRINLLLFDQFKQNNILKMDFFFIFYQYKRSTYIWFIRLSY